MIKSYFLRKKIKQNRKKTGLKEYPQKIDNIVILYKEETEHVDEFKLKVLHFFRQKIQIKKIYLGKGEVHTNSIRLHKRSLNYKGEFKEIALQNLLSKADLIFDISEMDGLVKNYAISLATHAYKISLNAVNNSQFQLVVKVDLSDLNQFFEEFVKYHNAFKNG